MKSIQTLFRSILKYSVFAISAALVFSSCKPDDPEPDVNNNPPAQTFDLTFKVNTLFAGNPLSWPTYYLTEANDTIQFDKIKFILSDFTLEKANGDLMELEKTYAYLNMREGRDSVILKGIPEGTYKSIRFKVGLDSAVNHGDPTQFAFTHPLSPALNDMHWGWAGGYIFNIVEGYYRKDNKNAGFSFHVALLKNARTFSFVKDFTMNTNRRAELSLHADKYFSNVVNYSLLTDGAFSHSGDTDPVMDKFIQNFPGLFELKSID